DPSVGHDRRRDRRRADPHGHALAGELTPADGDGRRHREPHRDHGSAGAEGVLTLSPAARRAPPFEKVLIANRGEIAVRIARACRELGVRSAAIYSEADRDALHVRHADEAHPCGPPPAAQSYLDIARIVEIARGCGADAVHPGYGFLSENADFAQACADAKLAFVGPLPATIRAMGDKVISRQRMQAAKVPVVPGTTERLGDDQALAVARELGFPVMVKAS